MGRKKPATCRSVEPGTQTAGFRNTARAACTAPLDSLDDGRHSGLLMRPDMKFTGGAGSLRGQVQALAEVAEVGFRSTRE